MKSFLLLPFLLLPLHAAPLKSFPARTSPQDLEVDEIEADGSLSPSRYYHFDEFLTLPQVTVKTPQDPNTLEPATYTGIYVSDLYAALGAKPDQTIMGMICYDKYKPYYDPVYNTAHKPIFLLKYNGKGPDQWPKSEHTTPMGPYCVVHENFQAGTDAAGEKEDPRIPFGVVKIELSTAQQSVGIFAPKKNLGDPEVMRGYRVAMGNCVNCHNIGNSGGQLAGRPWSILAAFASGNGDYFRSYILNPQKLNPASNMPAHPTYDDKTLRALQAYFQSTMGN